MLIDEELTEQIIGGLIDVHRFLGPGMLESTYKKCAAHELRLRGLNVATEVEVPVIYKGMKIDCGYRVDMFVEDRVILELKAVEKITPIHEAQLLSYLKLMQKRVGLLVNFNVKVLTDGITRRVL
jgi:GxxExxY protein